MWSEPQTTGDDVHDGCFLTANTDSTATEHLLRGSCVTTFTNGITFTVEETNAKQ